MWQPKVVSAALLVVAARYVDGVRGASSGSFQSRCDALSASLNIPDARVWFSQHVPAGTNLSFPDNDPTCTRPSQVVSTEVCRVALEVATSNESQITMEAWLPSIWTGRFLSTGNGGLSGCIQYEDMAYTSALGFATDGANNGHNGTSGEPFYNSPEVVKDFGYRSVHTNVVVGKQITQQFYGMPQNKSYFLGCSTGGRQGMKSAQSFPDDFDGIVAGAPAVAFNNLTSWSGTFYLYTGISDSPTFVPPDLWPTIHQDILSQCDALDGAVDGIIEDPLLCTYRPESLLCNSTSPSTNTTPCLTPAQAQTVRSIFSPLYGTNGTLIYPRMQPGSELNGAPQIYYSGIPFPYTTDWFRYAVYSDPSWSPSSLSPADFDAAYTANPGDVQAWSSLAPFRDSGGKLLHYHGQADQIISSDNSPRYYDFQARSLGMSSSELDQFYRFFRISGMGHCGGGNGAWQIGQTAAGNATLDPDGNVLMAMVRWVEEGVPPETVRGVSAAVGAGSEGNETVIVRRHCRYPYRNVYVGPGEVEREESWNCVYGF